MASEALVRKLPPTTRDLAPKRSIVFKFDKPWKIAHDGIEVINYEAGMIARVTPEEAEAMTRNKIGTEVKAKPNVDLKGQYIDRIEPVVDPEAN